jgi:dihydrofolate reductase
MQELLVDFITSLDGYGAAEGWPGFWGLQGPEYLAWLGEQPERDYTILMGANTYRLMSGFSAEAETLEADEAAAVEELARTPKVVFSSTLQPPLAWANTRLVGGDAVEAVAAMKRDGAGPMRTLGSLALCRSLLAAGLVDRFRVVVFPVITGSTGRDRIYDGYPDVAQPNVRRPAPAARVPPDGACRATRHAPGFLSPPRAPAPAGTRRSQGSRER